MINKLEIPATEKNVSELSFEEEDGQEVIVGTEEEIIKKIEERLDKLEEINKIGDDLIVEMIPQERLAELSELFKKIREIEKRIKKIEKRKTASGEAGNKIKATERLNLKIVEIIEKIEEIEEIIKIAMKKGNDFKKEMILTKDNQKIISELTELIKKLRKIQKI